MSRDDRFTDWSVPGNLIWFTPEQCSTCRHLLPVVGWKCKAFPGGIPPAMMFDEHEHRQPFPGDHGVRYEPVGAAVDPSATPG